MNIIKALLLLLITLLPTNVYAKPSVAKVVAEVVKEADGVGAIVRLGTMKKLPLGYFRGVFALDLTTKRSGKVNLNLFHGTVAGKHTKQIKLGTVVNVACHNATFKGHKAKKAKWLVTTTEEVQIIGLGGGLYWLGPVSVGERIAEVVTEQYTRK